MPKPQRAKTSLAELLAQQPEPQRNDWSNGRPHAVSNRSHAAADDGFPKYDPKDFASEEEEEEEENSGPGAGGAFAILAGLAGGEAEEDEWLTVSSKQKKKSSTQAPAAAPKPSAPPRRPTAPPAPATRPAAPSPAASFPRPLGEPAGSAAAAVSSAGPSRAPYTITQAAESAPRTPRPQTHDAGGRPISDTYYQTFQKVYRNTFGAVCMRFHKTDVVTVRTNGDVVLTSGGFHTRTTYCTIQEALEPLGLTLQGTGPEGRGEWSVVASDGSRTPWEDGMVIPAKTDADRGRGQRLLDAYGVVAPSAAAAARAAAGFGTAAASAGSAAVRAPFVTTAAAPAGPAPVRAPIPVPVHAPVAMKPPTTTITTTATTAVRAPSPSTTWSYRSSAGVSAASPAALRMSGSTASALSSVPVPTARTAESISNLQKLLDVALAMKDDAAAEASGGGGNGGGNGGATLAGGDGTEELDDEHACIACMAALKTTLLIPCGHMVMCGPCAEQVLQRTGACPMCRLEVVSHLTIQT